MVIRTLLIYLFLILAMRLMGKRQIGELQLSELVITLLLSELAAHPITDPEIPLCNAIFPVLILLSLEIILSYSITKIPLFKRMFNGSPSLLIHKGNIDIKELKRARLSIEEMLALIRQQGYSGFEEINYAILEQNGKISIVPHAAYATTQKKDLSTKIQEEGISHLLISDGKKNQYNIEFTHTDLKMIDQILNDQKIKKMSDVFILTINDVGEIYIAKKEKNKKHTTSYNLQSPPNSKKSGQATSSTQTQESNQKK